jgi:hypothetical protein
VKTAPGSVKRPYRFYPLFSDIERLKEAMEDCYSMDLLGFYICRGFRDSKVHRVEG